MDIPFQIGLVLLCLGVLVPCYGDPVAPRERPGTLGSGLFKSFDDVTQFLRSWFSKLQTSVKDFVDTNKRENKTDNERHLTKREIQPPQNFEEVEHDYLLLLSGEYLKQLFDYAKFISSDDKTRDGIDRVLQSEIDRLQHMTLEQLKAYCSKLHDMMARGVSLNNEITVNGNTYSLESIAHVCCPWG